MVKISGGKAGSVSRLKKQAERSSGGKTWIKGVKKGEDLTVRFLTEPDDWYAYREHFSPDVYFFPCIGEDADCPGCLSDNEKVKRSSRRWLASALDVSSGQVVPLKLTLDLTNRLIARYERYGNTILDRDYTLHRMGSGLETTYDVTPEAPSNVDTSRYDEVDLEAALVEQFNDAFGEDDSDVPSEPSSPPVEDDDDGEYLTEEEALKMSKDELKAIAEQVGIDVDGRWSVEKMVKAIFEAAA